MEKLIIALVLSLSALTIVHAQVEDTEAPAIDDSPKLEMTVAEQPHQLVQDYNDVPVNDLPQAVKETVAKDFEAATISNAFVNKKGEYKLILTLTDKENLTVFTNKQGEWIKDE